MGKVPRDRRALGSDTILHLAPLVGVDPDNVRKIIIVAEYNAITQVFVEMLGTHRLSEIDLTHPEIRGAQINVVNADKDEREGRTA